MHASVLDILAALKAQGVAITGVSSDSRTLQHGDVFLAYPGDEADGRNYINAAVEKGASAVVYEEDGFASPVLSVPAVASKQLKFVAGELAAAVYDHPSSQLKLIGVTGTNGKTSITQWLGQVFDLLSQKCALIGTLGNGFSGALRPSPNTTPDAVVLQQALRNYVNEGAVCCAMEVSSIGIEEGRIGGCVFDTAVFTNFTRDHLDYHGSMEAYAAAKTKLFMRDELKAVVLNLDDEMGRQLAKALEGKVHCIGYGLDAEVACLSPVDELLLATNVRVGSMGMAFDVAGQSVSVPVIGRFNVSNVLAVLGTLRATGVPVELAISVCAKLQAPPGRMQVLGGENTPLAVVDYAHTPDALEKALTTLREVSAERQGALHCVFGCGGDRDPGKRPMMGSVAASLADSVVLTSDNPRSEEPARILEDIEAGIEAGLRNKACIEADRDLAIRQAIRGAAKADVVLIAGKGHETYQEIAGVRTSFSDVAVAQAALREVAA